MTLNIIISVIAYEMLIQNVSHKFLHGKRIAHFFEKASRVTPYPKLLRIKMHSRLNNSVLHMYAIVMFYLMHHMILLSLVGPRNMTI